MTRDAIVALFDRRDAAWRRHDAAALAADHVEEAITESPMQGRLEGRRRIYEVYEQWLTAFPDMLFATSDLIIDGNRVAQFFSVTGTQAAPFGAVPSLKRRIQFLGAWLYTLDDNGQITHDRRVYDVTAVLVQIGALKARPAE